MISKLIQRGEDIFLQTVTDAVIDNNNKTLSSIITELEEKIQNLVNENNNLKRQLNDLEQKVTDGDSRLNAQVISLTERVNSLESGGEGSYESRLQTLENKTQKLGVDGNFDSDIKAPRYFQK